MLDHASVDQHGPQGVGDGWDRREQRRGEVTAARCRFVACRGDHKREEGADQRARALAVVAHAVNIPQRTTVSYSIFWNANFSRTRPMMAITAIPASMTSVL